MDAQLRDFDLNLLRVFAAVHATGSATLAAERLGVSQSAVSNALARLRARTGDPLFVRTPQGMSPTAFGSRIAGPIAEALDTVARSLAAEAPFDPARAARTFTIRMTDIGELVFLPTLLDRLAQAAPAVRLRAVSLSSGDTAAALARGEVDLAIGFLPELREGWYQQRLFEQRYVCLMRTGHPLAGTRLSARGFAAARHLAIESAGSGHGIVDDALAALGVRRELALRVPDFLGAVMLCAGSDLVCTVPLKLALAAQRLVPVTWQPVPHRLPGFTIHQYWHPRAHRDAAGRWLRALVAEAFAEAPMSGEPGPAAAAPRPRRYNRREP